MKRILRKLIVLRGHTMYPMIHNIANFAMTFKKNTGKDDFHGKEEVQSW